MQSPVKFKKMGNKFRVYFSYNSDLVEIMRENEGWWVRSDKAWQFAIGLYEKLYDELTSKKYKVQVIKDDKKSEVQRLKVSRGTFDKDVFQVMGVCPKCKRYTSIYIKTGICQRCM